MGHSVRRKYNRTKVLRIKDRLFGAPDHACAHTKLVAVIEAYCSTKFAKLNPPFGCCMSPYRSDYLFTCFNRAVRFEPLGSTSFRNSRYTFLFRGLARYCLLREVHRIHTVFYAAIASCGSPSQLSSSTHDALFCELSCPKANTPA